MYLQKFLLGLTFLIKTPKEEFADGSENYTKSRDDFSNYELWNLNE